MGRRSIDLDLRPLLPSRVEEFLAVKNSRREFLGVHRGDDDAAERRVVRLLGGLRFTRGVELVEVMQPLPGFDVPDAAGELGPAKGFGLRPELHPAAILNRRLNHSCHGVAVRRVDIVQVLDLGILDLDCHPALGRAELGWDELEVLAVIERE